MSLINDVLRDVERRRGDPSPDRRAAAPLPRRGPRLSLLWWLLPAAVAGVALHWIFSEPGPVHDSATRMNASLADASPAARVEPAALPIADTPSVATPTDAQDTRQTPDAPENDNEGNDAGTTPAFVEDVAESVQPISIPAADRQTKQASTDEVARHEPAPAGEGTPTSRSSKPPERDASDNAISIRPADETQSSGTADELEAARRALARNQFSVAERRIRGILESEPGHNEARLLLAGALLRRGEPVRAARLLEDGLEASDRPAELAARLGRILIENGQTARAIGVLASHAPQPIDDPDYHQLLAAAHRQAGDHESALSSYQALTEIVPGRGAVWIGLGASLEALDRPAEAIEAYQRARGAGDGRAARFASQRLGALKQANGESR